MNRNTQIGPTDSKSRSSGQAVDHAVIQRKCACGKAASGDCEECKDKEQKVQRYPAGQSSSSDLLNSIAGSPRVTPPSSPGSEKPFAHDFSRIRVAALGPQSVQTKLDISQPGDSHEVEADRIAQQVTLGFPAAPRKDLDSSATAPGLIQRSPVGLNPAVTAPQAAGPVKTETPEDKEASHGPLIVEDDAQQLEPGQMRKSEFIDELQRVICSEADAELARVGRSTEGCPYIERWMTYYRNRTAAQGERSLRRYAPETAGVTNARDYIPIVAARVRRAVSVWATTGRITDVPPELAAQLPGAGLLGAASGIVGGIGRAFGGLFAKARDGGVNQVDDPGRIRTELGSGGSLEGSVRSRMESAFGYDFSRVRIHNDANAARLSNELNARAFTVGTNVAFASGEYRPGSLVGDALIAHELAHVVQQGGGSASVAPLRPGADNSDLERDADSSAVRAVTSLWSGAGNLSKNAIPRLRSGIGLSRCGAQQTRPPAAPRAEQRTGETPAAPSSETRAEDTAAQTSPAAPEAAPAAAEEPPDTLVLPEFDCSPKGVTLSELTAMSGSMRTLGWTEANQFRRNFTPLFHSKEKNCRIGNITEAKFSLKHFAYVKADPNGYRYGTEKRQHSTCGSKDLDMHIEVNADMAEKFKQGEIEHCEDLRRAFAFTFMRFNKAAREIEAEAPFPSNSKKECNEAIKTRLAEKMGMSSYDSFGTIRDCLFDKTKERDRGSPAWHDVDTNATSARTPDADCKKVTYVLDPNHKDMMPELGKHPSRKLVKGCGE